MTATSKLVATGIANYRMNVHLIGTYHFPTARALWLHCYSLAREHTR